MGDLGVLYINDAEPVGDGTFPLLRNTKTLRATTGLDRYSPGLDVSMIIA
jgi:hypothetical protein